MATVAVIVGAAIVNAIAFTTGNALYDKFGRTDAIETELLKIYKKHRQNGVKNDWKLLISLTDL